MEAVIQYIREEPTILAIPFYIVTMAVENVVLLRQNRAYAVADTAASLSGGLGSLVVRFFWNFAFVWLLKLCFDAGPRLFDAAPPWAAWPVLVVLDDFAFYCMHRCAHEIRFFWAAHVVHHSSQRYHLATALRQSWTAPLIETPFWLPVAFLGFPPHWILVQMSVSLLYQYWIHTETIGRLGLLEYVLNTPSHHRVHHGSNPEYLDTNYGGIFILWDRLFGTFAPEAAPVRYGLTHNLRTHNWVSIQLHEYIAMFRGALREREIRHRLRQLFGSPTALYRDGATRIKVE